MIWTKFTVDTTTEAEDLVSDFLNDMGVEGVMIEDNVPLTEEEIAEMFVDIPLVGEDDGTAKVSCFLPEGFDGGKVDRHSRRDRPDSRGDAARDGALFPARLVADDRHRLWPVSFHRQYRGAAARAGGTAAY